MFYAIYIAGMVWFAVRPGLAGGVPAALLNGALLGGLAYATYDLTNQATLKVWSTQITADRHRLGRFRHCAGQRHRRMGDNPPASASDSRGPRS